MSQIGKRHPTELKHQSSNRLCAPQTIRLGIFVKKPSKFTHRKSPFLTDIHSCIHITEQTMYIGPHGYRYCEAYAYTLIPYSVLSPNHTDVPRNDAIGHE